MWVVSLVCTKIMGEIRNLLLFLKTLIKLVLTFLILLTSLFIFICTKEKKEDKKLESTNWRNEKYPPILEIHFEEIEEE